MIAICGECHQIAESGRWSVGDLNAMKRGPHEVPTSGVLAWRSPRLLTVAGGNLWAGGVHLLTVGEQVIVGVERDENGFLGLTARWHDEEGGEVFSVVCNEITVASPDDLWDVQGGVQRKGVKMQFAKGRINLDAYFERRNLEEVIRQHGAQLPSEVHGLTKLLPPDVQQRLGQFMTDRNAPLREQGEPDGTVLTLVIERLDARLPNGRALLTPKDTKIESGGFSFEGSGNTMFGIGCSAGIIRLPTWQTPRPASDL